MFNKKTFLIGAALVAALTGSAVAQRSHVYVGPNGTYRAPQADAYRNTTTYDSRGNPTFVQPRAQDSPGYNRNTGYGVDNRYINNNRYYNNNRGRYTNNNARYNNNTRYNNDYYYNNGQNGYINDANRAVQVGPLRINY